MTFPKTALISILWLYNDAIICRRIKKQYPKSLLMAARIKRWYISQYAGYYLAVAVRST